MGERYQRELCGGRRRASMERGRQARDGTTIRPKSPQNSQGPENHLNNVPTIYLNFTSTFLVSPKYIHEGGRSSTPPSSSYKLLLFPLLTRVPQKQSRNEVALKWDTKTEWSRLAFWCQIFVKRDIAAVFCICVDIGSEKTTARIQHSGGDCFVSLVNGEGKVRHIFVSGEV